MVWPWLLARRLDGRAGGQHSRRIRGGARRLLPASPVGAVVGRELRLWLRDPIRTTFLLIGLVVGFGVCVELGARSAGS